MFLVVSSLRFPLTQQKSREMTELPRLKSHFALENIVGARNAIFMRTKLRIILTELVMQNNVDSDKFTDKNFLMLIILMNGFWRGSTAHITYSKGDC